MEELEEFGQDTKEAKAHREDFDFFDFLRIFWRRRYIVLFGTAVILVIIAVLSFSTPPVYRSKTTVMPGLNHIDEERRMWVFLDTPIKMKFIIESQLRYKVAQQKRKSKDPHASFPPIFKVLADKESNSVSILCDSPAQNDGIISLQLLLEALREFYQKRLSPFLFKLESGIALARKELMLISKEQEFINANLNAVSTRFEKFKLENASDMEDLPASNKEGRYLVQYTAIIDRIARLEQTRNTIALRSAELETEIKKMDNEKNDLSAIQVVQPPVTISVPNRKNLILNLVAAPVVGFCLMTFLVFFFEYLRRLIPKIKQKSIFE